ncbi:hypothetical protein [Rubinisphaera sp.]|uniref:hypothetical protein n=1 Tax=Rubinisphaera sp. TaxID=2024857 RepID=UPI0025DDE5AB|nr:hypothetical protein [Rubinisphaera sp.]|tara:strand:- start:88 stop:249 length:162 start_codon:yes stop_codon:yes gene_type:complete
MQKTDEQNDGRDVDGAAERDQLASNLAFLIVQALRRDQHHVDESKNATTFTDS